MKDHLAELVRASPTATQGRNVAREYLQARILGGLQRAEVEFMAEQDMVWEQRRSCSAW